MTSACGVDFGTSNSTVGWLAPGRPLLLALEGEHLTLPSVVFFNAEDETTHYGRDALQTYLAGYEGRLMRSMKSLLGTPLLDGQTEVLGRALPFRELLTQFIGELRRRAEAAAGQRFDHAVIGRPMHFVDEDPVADQQAEDGLRNIATAAGFRDLHFQYEPIAAAFEYEASLTQEQRVLVVDIGGGTSDFSLIRLGPERMAQADRRADVLASGGVHIGGTDFDRALNLQAFMPLLGMGSRLKSGADMPSAQHFNLATWHTINFAYLPKVERELHDLQREAVDTEAVQRLLHLIRQRDGHWLAMQAEASKIALTTATHWQPELSRLRPACAPTLSREDFEGAARALVERIAASVLKVLERADTKAKDVDVVFFTGGGSGLPLLRRTISALLPDARSVEGDLFGSIGAGLARDAARRFD